MFSTRSPNKNATLPDRNKTLLGYDETGALHCFYSVVLLRLMYAFFSPCIWCSQDHHWLRGRLRSPGWGVAPLSRRSPFWIIHNRRVYLLFLSSYHHWEQRGDCSACRAQHLVGYSVRYPGKSFFTRLKIFTYAYALWCIHAIHYSLYLYASLWLCNLWLCPTQCDSYLLCLSRSSVSWTISWTSFK
jgi:hypothetical protein